MKFVGRCYGGEGKQSGTISHKWGERFSGNLLKPLYIESEEEEPLEDCNAFYRPCCHEEGEPFEYWISIFLPLDAAVSDGYGSIGFDAGEIAVGWVYGKELGIYSHCCLERFKQEGLEWATDKTVYNGALSGMSPCALQSRMRMETESSVRAFI